MNAECYFSLEILYFFTHKYASSGCQTGIPSHCTGNNGNNSSIWSSKSFLYSMGAFGALAFILFVCHCIKLMEEAEENDNINANTTQRTVNTDRIPRETDIQLNGQVDRIEMNSVNEPWQHEEAFDQIYDPTADSAPQSYIEVEDETVAPPPSYEEVMRASQEALHSRTPSHHHHVTTYI
ncbi:uncharacterized protein LOC111338636 isoform X2 [Stylophora pistillata]|uniref:uncharacterized protein LOC111338636 isoform X2 n=1 Tax=Stylophora pistillata TaxID=50429 RepID=UPI000C055F9F|nr:uncharacterized protein LOC111338636 isoform X2 [Stylophora pistillata]